jgi:Zn-dependent protease
LGKAKTLLVALKFLKLGTLVSMVVSIGAYSLLFGWPFAVGFVLLIFVHELGHAIAMGQMGIRASAPVFIPFVGAVIAMRGRPRDAFVEAVVGIGGPLLGSLGAVLCLVAAVATGSPLLYALASTGFFLNLFNMLPLSPLDGGRIAGAISRWLWVIGFALAVGAFVLTWNPMLLLILLLGVLQLLRLRSHPVPGYYDIVPWKRALIGAGYFGLIALLAFATQVADAALAATGHRVALMHAAAAAAGLLLARAGR